MVRSRVHHSYQSYFHLFGARVNITRITRSLIIVVVTLTLTQL